MRVIFLALGILAGLFGAARGAEQQPLDVVLALDNSSGMQTNDPKGLLDEAAKLFASRLNSSDQLGIVSFDRGVHRLLELGSIAPGSVDAALGKINYRGAGADMPGGLEAARYDLEHRGRNDAQKVVLLISDGAIDLGTIRRDRERKEWLESSVMPALVDQHVRVFAIALVKDKDADVELIQRATTGTGATYYPVKFGSELPGVFNDVNSRLRDLRAKERAAAEAAQATANTARQAEADRQKLAEETALGAQRAEEAAKQAEADRQKLEEETAQAARREAEAAEAKKSAEALVTEAQNTLKGATVANQGLVETARQAEAQAATERKLTIWAVLAGVVAIAAIVTAVLWRRRTPKVAVPAARLLDIGGQSGSPEHKIAKPITRIGALEGQDVRINEVGVSRTHAIIVYKNGDFYLRDLRSTNGTFLNEQQLPGDDATGRLLKHGDDMRFGPYSFRFVVDELKRAENAPDPVKTRRVASGTVRLDQSPVRKVDQMPSEVPAPVPADRPVADPPKPNEPRLTIVKPEMDPHRAIGPEDKCDVHQSRKAEVPCSRCGGLICQVEEPVPDGAGGTACKEVIERGTCDRLKNKVA